MWSQNQSTEQATNVGVNAYKRSDPLILFPYVQPQAAINAMNLEQQLSQYAFFSQQPSSQNHQRQQVSFFSKRLISALREGITIIMAQRRLD